VVGFHSPLLHFTSYPPPRRGLADVHTKVLHFTPSIGGRPYFSISRKRRLQRSKDVVALEDEDSNIATPYPYLCGHNFLMYTHILFPNIFWSMSVYGYCSLHCWRKQFINHRCLYFPRSNIPVFWEVFEHVCSMSKSCTVDDASDTPTLGFSVLFLLVLGLLCLVNIS
jgi:hypothetical protein